jgi:hypothetical protein
MELPWNICPFCGTAAPGVRRDGADLDEALKGLNLEGEPGEVRLE